mmetsp:Transcript_21600/g.49098  ORF Transcript_21600/g.49098 Transcript_21600/m.49098 type:complete len:566 (+) Transcript_21600:379-2076(+)
MLFFKVTVFLLSAFTVDSWNLISDARVTNKDVTPVLGRGYSIATGEFHSICLMVNAITDPTSDYHYDFFSIEPSVSLDASYSEKRSGPSLTNPLVKSLEDTKSGTIKGSGHVHHVVSSMNSNRYYTSMDETETSIIGQLTQTLARGNVIQFFQACGPSYIRSLRRTTDITATFTYVSVSVNADLFMNDVIQRESTNYNSSRDRSASIKIGSSISSLHITILAHGLSLNLAASGETDRSLVARDMDDYKTVMDAAFKSMQDPHAGKVISVELVPWTANAAFQNALQIDTPLSRTSYRCYYNESGIPMLQNGDPFPDCSDGTNGNPATTCGYHHNDTELADSLDATKCRNIGTESAVEKELRKFNLVANAELISRLDAIIRKEITYLEIHMNCISDLIMYPRGYDTKLLYSRRRQVEVPDMDVKTLTWKLLAGDSHVMPTGAFLIGDPAPGGDGDAYLFNRKMIQVTDYITFFFEPCMIALGTKKYQIIDGNMHLNHWSGITACNKVMCHLPNTAYDSSSSGCISMSSNATLHDFIQLNSRLDQYCPPMLKQDISMRIDERDATVAT